MTTVWRAALCWAGLATALWASAGTARAEPQWGFQWEPGSQVFKTGTGGVTLTAELPGTGQGNQEILLTHISTFASPLTAGETLNNARYTFTLTLTDLASGKSAKATFSGILTGTFNNTTASIANAFIGPTEAKFRLGQNQYLVTIGPYLAPGAPTSGKIGSIGAYVEMKPLSAQNLPEPSTLVLAGLGAPLLALRRWRRRVAAG
jgi:hypothetical protein